MRSLAAVVVAVASALALVSAYAALGGLDYSPTPVADPCEPRPWRAPDGVAQSLEQIALSTADGVGCRLGTSREEVVLALAGVDELRQYARSNGLSDDLVQDAVRAGLIRAVDDAEAADAIGGTLADILRGAARRLPISFVLELIQGVSGVVPG